MQNGGYGLMSPVYNDIGADGDYNSSNNKIDNGDDDAVSFPPTVGTVSGKSNVHNDEVFKHLMGKYLIFTQFVLTSPVLFSHLSYLLGNFLTF